MARYVLFVPFLLLVIVVAGCLGYKPRMTPDRPELLIDEGDELVIKCVSTSAFKVIFPETETNEDIKTSEHEIIHEHNYQTGMVKRIFQRKSTVFGDTGWYGCVDEDVDETDEGDYSDPNSSWIYVYVRSKDFPFTMLESKPLVAFVNDTFVVPCRPTSPELHVSLTFNFEPVELDDRVSYDPKRGFIIKNILATDTGVYDCSVDPGDREMNTTELEVSVFVSRKRIKKVAHISDENLQHVTKGSELNVTCTAQINSDSGYRFIWTTPRETAIKKQYSLPPYLTIEHERVVGSVLNIQNVTYDDEGEYRCKINTMAGIIEAHKYINIYDPANEYINLTVQDTSSFIQVQEQRPVRLKVYIDAHPQPTITWMKYDSKGVLKYTDIPSDMHLSINVTKTFTQLDINRAYKSDAGIYVLQAFHNDTSSKRLNFTVEVLGVPATILNNEDNIAFYSVNQTAKFSCTAYNNPPSKVQISYSKCPHYPIMEYCETVELDSTTVQDLLTEKIVRVKFPAEYPGTITCTACNEMGCDSADLQIFLTDGLPNQKLGITSDPEMVTANDDVTLTCMAPIYNSSAVEWQDNNYDPIRNSDRAQVIFANTTYTRRSILKIRDVHKSDEADYACISISPDGEEDRVIIHLEVHDPMEPVIKATNMNGSETELTVEEAHNIVLTCYSEGKPYPNTTWYKDDQPLIADGEQFIFIENNQELIIDYLTASDSGEYKCVAKNRVNQAVVSQRFLVKGPTISAGWILAIVGVLVFLVSLLIYFCIKVRRERRMRKQLIEVGLMHFEEGALDCINPELTVDDQADLLPYDRKWEFPRDKLKLGKQLGSGAFGVVMKAEARGILADESLTTVAVKMVHRNAEPAYIRALASELKIMVHLGKHLNVVNLLGACTNNIAKRELLVIVEYCRYGNLHNYLLRHRGDFINQIDPENGKIDPLIGSEFLMRSTSAGSNIRLKYAALSFSRSLSSASDNGRSAPGTETVIYTTETQELAGLPNAGFNSNGSQPGWRSNYRGDYKDRNLKPICTQDLLSWAFQVARGMEYLCQRKVLHGDLAARNILLAENNVVKICDFGLAKTMYKDDNYQKKGNGPVPIKWMAVESIRDRVFSTQSDIWSFGIVLWEFFTLAETPYPGMKAETQYQRLIEGYRMEQPKYATKDIYNIMLQCWKAKPALRPTFSELVEDIGELLEEGVRRHYVDLNSLYVETIDEQHDYLKMMSAPDHNMLAGPQHDYVNCPQVSSDPAMNSPTEESVIFSPRPNSQDNTRFQFPSPAAAKIANANNSDGEDSPMLKKLKEEPELDEDNYLKPIDVQKKRDEFTRQREAEKRKSEERSARASTDRDSGYCNTPKALELIDVKVETPNYRNLDDVDAPTMILKTPDEKYSWRHKNELRKPESFMNPSYVFVQSSKPNQDTL